MIRNKVEIEIIKTNSGKIRIGHGGGSALVPDNWDNIALIPFLEVALLSSLGISGKMDFKIGDRVFFITDKKHSGVVTKANDNEIDVVIRMDDDAKELIVNRKDLNHDN